MKKQLLWGMMLIIAGFSSCQKDTFKPANQTSVGSKDKLKTNVVNPTYFYHDLVLQSRQAGENFDTYLGNWGGVSIKMIGSPVWDHDLYPNLVNGVPAYNASYIVGDQNQVMQISANGEDAFILNVATIPYTDFQAFQNDFEKYDKASDDWMSKVAAGTATGADYPLITTYIKQNYSTGLPGYVSYSGKLIRVTTGSHWAIATGDYPRPVPIVQPTSYGMSFVYPAGSNYEYDVSVNNGLITSITGLNRVTYQTFPAHYNSGGTWTRIAGTTHYHITGLNVTGTPAGTPVTFAFTGNTEDAY